MDENSSPPGAGTTGTADLPSTGDDAVDEALRSLGGLQDRPLREHVTALEAVHGALSDRLAEGRV